MVTPVVETSPLHMDKLPPQEESQLAKVITLLQHQLLDTVDLVMVLTGAAAEAAGLAMDQMDTTTVVHQLAEDLIVLVVLVVLVMDAIHHLVKGIVVVLAAVVAETLVVLVALVDTLEELPQVRGLLIVNMAEVEDLSTLDLIR